MAPVLEISGLTKSYASGLTALDDVSLSIERGEIFALLGPNGAGKTTLIGTVCGIVNATSGQILVDGHDHVADFRAARSKIGLVPQELTTDAFETVWNTVRFTRGLFGKPRDDAYLEQLLTDLSLIDKRDSAMMTLSGGMKRRVLIAKALSHQPDILFLDEPTAGVDVELRQDMWALVSRLRDSGVTVVLTTHYLEEAEEMADRVGVISGGEIVLVEETAALMRKLGEKKLTLQLSAPIEAIPPGLTAFDLDLSADGCELVYTYDTAQTRTGITRLLNALSDAGIRFRDLQTEQSSLEDIFVSLVRREPRQPAREEAAE